MVTGRRVDGALGTELGAGGFVRSRSLTLDLMFPE